MQGQQHKVKDALALFFDSVTMAAGTTGSVATHDSSAIDLGAADVDQYLSKEVIVDVPTAFTSGGSATIAFTVLDCDTSGGTYAALTPVPAGTGDIAFNDAILTTGDKLRIPIPKYGVRRYIKLRYEIKVATLTGGVLDAWLEAE